MHISGPYTVRSDAVAVQFGFGGAVFALVVKMSATLPAQIGSCPYRNCCSLAARVRRPTSPPRLVVEAFIIAFAVIVLVWLAWVALWLIEQRGGPSGAPRDRPVSLRISPGP
jgi:hypothetical protein